VGQKGWTPLHVAYYQGNFVAIKTLLDTERSKILDVEIFRRSLTNKLAKQVAQN
jgi:hypothetical protein